MIKIDTDKNIDIESLEIEDLIDIDILQKFQDNFAESMDIASIIVDRKGNPVTKPSTYTEYCTNFIHSTCIGDNACAKSHLIAGEVAAKTGKPYIHECHAGLVDFAMPIIVKDIHIGTILGGQILNAEPKDEKYRAIAKRIEVNEEALLKSIKTVKKKTKKNIAAAAEALFIIANELSNIGYQELKLKGNSKKLESEIIKKNIQLKESEEISKLKTQFFATMSHELKTPLNIIFSSVQLLEDVYYKNEEIPPKETFAKYSKIMKQNCYRLIRITNNLIDINRIELGSYSLRFNNEDIVRVVEDITLSVVEFAKLKELQLTFDTDVEEKIIACDSEKLERIMLNLLSNAIKFTKPGGSIYVNMEDKNTYIAISVKDTGCGIPKCMSEKIFDNFVQVDSSLRRNVEGSGIGLSLVKSLVEMHGGTIEVMSELGIGSEFIIKLPTNLNKDKVVGKCDKKASLGDNVEKIKIEFSDIYM